MCTVYSVSNLHAKVFALCRTAYIGSAVSPDMPPHNSSKLAFGYRARRRPLSKTVPPGALPPRTYAEGTEELAKLCRLLRARGNRCATRCVQRTSESPEAPTFRYSSSRNISRQGAIPSRRGSAPASSEASIALAPRRDGSVGSGRDHHYQSVDTGFARSRKLTELVSLPASLLSRRAGCETSRQDTPSSCERPVGTVGQNAQRAICAARSAGSKPGGFTGATFVP